MLYLLLILILVTVCLVTYYAIQLDGRLHQNSFDIAMLNRTIANKDAEIDKKTDLLKRSISLNEELHSQLANQAAQLATLRNAPKKRKK